MNRREFLGGLVFGAVAAATGGCRMFGGAKGFDDSLTVFISDTHVCPIGYQEDNMLATVDQILAMDPLPRRVIGFGDIAFLHGHIEDYQAMKKILDRITDAGIELYLGLGNHDRRGNFAAVFPEQWKKSVLKGYQVLDIDLGGCDLIMLDTLHEPDGLPKDGWITDGQMKKDQFEWLKAEVVRRKRPFFLAAHHPINEITDGDWKAINDLVVKTPLCIGWIHGHDHEWRHYEIQLTTENWWGKHTSKRVLCLPSTGHWGDIGYVKFRAKSDAARAELVINDHFFPEPKDKDRRDIDRIDELRGSFMTFRY